MSEKVRADSGTKVDQDWDAIAAVLMGALVDSANEDLPDDVA